ncbi:hypothetical protein, partial [Pseudomonas brassicacearum]|uniref:hypothetical protein n=1 Tax=Pseudomonas brassicacearum TaxID=930166 RepID=UPI0021825667
YYLFRQSTTWADESFTAADMNEGGIDDIGTLTLSEAQKLLNYLIHNTSETLRALDLVIDSEFSLTVEKT